MLYGNIARVIVLPLALAAATYSERLDLILGAFIFGEILALMLALLRLKAAKVVGLRRDGLRVLVFIVLCCGVVGIAAAVQCTTGMPALIAALAVSTTALAAAITLDRSYLLRDAGILTGMLRGAVSRRQG